MLLAVAATAIASGEDAVREALRLRIEAVAAGFDLVVGEDRIHAVTTLRDFYERRAFKPAWLAGGRPVPSARELVDTIGGAELDGLRKTDYHWKMIGARMPAPGRISAVGPAVDLELLLTDAFLLMAAHRLAGHLNPESIDPEWRATRRGADLTAVLENALETRGVREALDGLLPPQNGYVKLREALARYRALAARGGWPALPEGPALRAGDAGPRVEALAARLRASEDLEAETGDGTPGFEDRLERAVRGFQDRHGLDVDGIVGPKTLRALNIHVETRIRQIIVNMERWRWLPQSLGVRHILVNTAGSYLECVESGEVVLDMRVIVGRSYRRTPVFSDTMTYLVFNPTWEVPAKLAAQDILPQLKSNPDYLQAKGFAVWDGWGADAREIGPETVDWSRIPAGTFPYRLRQRPGPENALGRVKFMFPNAFNVYLHDTPSRELFARSDRALSSGCIRVEKPLDLAAWLLAGHASWDRAAIATVLDDGLERTVWLSRPVPVHLLYWTAWIDERGQLHFREDIYGRDLRVEQALAEPPPEPEGDH